MKSTLALLFVFCPLSFAQVHIDVQDQAINPVKGVVPNRAILRVEPKYPVAEARERAEGWVKLNFLVLEDGSVAEPRVVDSSGVRGFEREAIKAIKQWKYSPVMKDGKPANSCASVQLDFRIDQKGRGARKRFKNAYQEAKDALEANELNVAREKIAAMGNSKFWNSYEDAWYWNLKAQLAELEKDDSELLLALNRATSPGYKYYLNLPLYFELMYKKFAIEFETNKYADAFKTYEAITKTKDSAEVVNLLGRYIRFMSARLASDLPIEVAGQLNKEGDWIHRLSRHRFSLTGINGEINILEARCDYRWEKFTNLQQDEWLIPASWGICSIFVQGSPDTSFTLLEQADEIKLPI